MQKLKKLDLSYNNITKLDVNGFNNTIIQILSISFIIKNDSFIYNLTNAMYTPLQKEFYHFRYYS